LPRAACVSCRAASPDGPPRRVRRRCHSRDSCRRSSLARHHSPLNRLSVNHSLPRQRHRHRGRPKSRRAIPHAMSRPPRRRLAYRRLRSRARRLLRHRSVRRAATFYSQRASAIAPTLRRQISRRRLNCRRWRHQCCHQCRRSRPNRRRRSRAPGPHRCGATIRLAAAAGPQKPPPRLRRLPRHRRPSPMSRHRRRCLRRRTPQA